MLKIKDMINKGRSITLEFSDTQLWFEGVDQREEIFKFLKAEWENADKILKARFLGKPFKLKPKEVKEFPYTPKVKVLGKIKNSLKEVDIFYQLILGEEKLFIGEEKQREYIDYWKAYTLSAIVKKVKPNQVIFLTKAPKQDLEELIFRNIGVTEGKRYWETKINLVQSLNSLPKDEKSYTEFKNLWRNKIFKLLYFRPPLISEVQEGLLFYLLSEDLKGEDALAIEEYYKQIFNEKLTISEKIYKKHLSNLEASKNLEYFIEDLEEYDIYLSSEIEKIKIEIEEENWIERLGYREMEIPKWLFDFVINSFEYENPYSVLLKLKKGKEIYNMLNYSEELRKNYTKYELLTDIL
jgi:hypothetical protein